MSAEIVDIAEALKLTLNGQTFAAPFTAERTYRTVLDLEALTDLQVLVVPKAQDIAVSSRVSDQFDCAIDVVVQQKLNTTTMDEIDSLMDLIQEIIDFLRGARLESLPGVAPISVENEPVFDPKHLETERVFSSLITVTYRAWRTRT